MNRSLILRVSSASNARRVSRTFAFLLPILASVALGQVDPALISHWQANGTGADITSRNPAEVATGYGPGRSGQAFLFNGSSGYVAAGPSASLNAPSTTNRITVSAWVRWDGGWNPDYHPIVRKCMFNTDTNGWPDGAPWHTYELGLSLAGNPVFSITSGVTGSAPVAVSGTAAVIAGTWYYVTGTYDGAVLRVYLNGTLQGSRSTTITIGAREGRLLIGRDIQVGGNRFHGAIDDIKVYSRALSSTEIQAEFTGLPPSGPTIEALQEEIRRLNAQIDLLVRELAQCNDADAAGQAQIAALQASLAAAQSTINGLNSANRTLQTQLDAANATIAHLTAELATAGADVARLSRELADANATIAGLNADVARLAQHVADRDRTIAELRAEIAALRNDRESLAAQLASARSENARLQQDLAAERSVSATLRSSLADANATIASLTAANAQLATENAQLRQLQTATAASLAALNQMLASAFNSPTFQVPGATLDAQLQNLIGAIGNLNNGQKQALYRNLGGQ